MVFRSPFEQNMPRWLTRTNLIASGIHLLSTSSPQRTTTTTGFNDLPEHQNVGQTDSRPERGTSTTKQWGWLKYVEVKP